MDLWVVAAAAGAGYIAKNLQNISVDKRETLGGFSSKYAYNVQSESRNLLQQLREKTCPLRRLERQRFQDNASHDMGNHSDNTFSETDRMSIRDGEAGVASTNGDAFVKTGILEDHAAEGSLKFEDGESRNFGRGKMIRYRRCRVHSMRPLNTLGSCLENVEHSTCLCPSMSRVRPVLVTDGRWGSNSSFDGCREGVRREDGVALKVTNTESSSSLEQFESVGEIRKPERRSGNLQQRSLSWQGPDSMLLFITGMTVGILSATTSWKNEVDKLNKQLRQIENLVQDLHEELDMKEMLMVKELTDEGEGDLPSGGNDTPLSLQEPISSPSDVNVDKLKRLDSLKRNEKDTENLELLSRIEAELQAELEMLEQSMKASALERISSAVELDPDFEPDIVDGDLKPRMMNDASESGNETTDTTTNSTKSANYAVSPWELSLRLHELIESRLETRINELEIALGDSSNRVRFQGSRSMVSGRTFSYSGTESSSTHQSPCTCDEHDKRGEEPSTENFSSNYMNASNEPNGILRSVTDKDRGNEDGEFSCKTVDQGKHSIDRIQNGEYDSISHHGVSTEEDGSVTLVQDMPKICDKQRSTSFISSEDSRSEDESNDESEMLLIKHIVERRKSGSSLNLKID